MRSRLLVLLLPLPLAACLSGGNTKGDFACKAPDGTCAPMTLIDGQAVAGIGNGGGAMAPIRSPGTLAPPASPLRTVAGSVAGEETPARTHERVLRVVFPAHIDPDGVYREESAAHAVIEPTAWAEALRGPALAPKRVPALRAAGAVPAAVAPAGAGAAPLAQAQAPSLLASMDELVAMHAARRTEPAPAAASASSATSVSQPAAANPTVAAPPFSTGAVVSSFRSPGRSPTPMSLAEAASGLSAPPVARLDPRGPGNYDTPDLVASVAPAPGEVVVTEAANIVTPKPAMRTVRWKGKLYRIPVRGRASPAAPVLAAASPARAVPTTADLNRRALATSAPEAEPSQRTEAAAAVATPPVVAPPPPAPVASTPTAQAAPAAASGGATAQALPSAGSASAMPPTRDPAVAAARVKAMAAPQLEMLASKDGVIDLAPVADLKREAANAAAQEPKP